MKSNYDDQDLHSSSITVYGSQFILSSELERILNSQTRLVSINICWSTNGDRPIAENFIQSKPTGMPKSLNAVFFEVTIESSAENLIPCNQKVLKIGNLYYYQNGNELLFAPETTLETTDYSASIDSTNNKKWNIVMKHTHEIKLMIEIGDIWYYWKENMFLETSEASFGWLMIQMGQFDQADKYYSLLITHLESIPIHVMTTE
ncbi:unnamed protein product [Rotaria sp. Silwood1]|nr:unnamed protein product [Rotaria sp. Silwood1]CAF1622006.1 unnamed protein product [Rotaria sp. Silwood1]CAF3842984.1 unnamed protein product [Rotaria sp. Silwood1]CAF4917543.1 unnamed protein product [Rotaria sp. Silwood1]